MTWTSTTVPTTGWTSVTPGSAAVTVGNGLGATIDFTGLLQPDSSGYAAWQASSVNNANDLAPAGQVLAFADAGSALIASYADGVPVPANYLVTRSPVVTIVWRSVAAEGAVRWVAKYCAIGAGESNDPSAWQTALAATTVVSGVARALNYTTLAMTASDLSAGDTMLWLIGRDISSSADTLAAAAEIVSVRYAY